MKGTEHLHLELSLRMEYNNLKIFLIRFVFKMYDTCTLSDTEISVSHIDMKVSLAIPLGYDQY